MVKYKVVRNYNDANTLIEMGNKLLKIDRDRNNRDYLINVTYGADNAQRINSNN